MNTKLLILPQIALAALLMTGAGCRTYSPTRANSQAKSFQIQIPAGTAVRVCLPEEGRYYQALFQAPKRHDPKALPPPDWVPGWIEDEGLGHAINAGGEISNVLLGIPILSGFLVHAFIGPVVYNIAGQPTPYAAKARTHDVAAMAAVSRAWTYERELKTSVQAELRRSGLTVIDGEENEGDTENTAAGHVATLNLYIVAAGMIRNDSFGKAQNPPQSFHLDVRAELADLANPPVTMRLTFDSDRARFREWAADGASRFAAVRKASMQSIANQLAGRLISPLPALRSFPETRLASQP